MASRFFATGDSSDDEEDRSGDEVEAAPEESKQESNRFISGLDSSDSEDEKRTVRTAKDKRWEEMHGTLKAIRNHVKIGDWSGIVRDMAQLDKQMAKAAAVVRKEGVPGFYLKQILSLDSLVKTAWADTDARKALSKTNAQALSALKQLMKKTITKYTKEIETYQKAPLADDAEEAEEEEKKPKKSAKKPAAKKEEKKAPAKKADDEEEEGEADEKEEEEEEEEDKPAKKAPKAKKEAKKEKKTDEEEGEGDGEGDVDEKWDMSDESGSDVDVEDLEGESKGAMFSRDFWVKKEVKEDVKGPRVRVSGPKREPRPEPVEVKEKKDGPKVELTPEMVVKKLRELMASRGKKGTDRVKMIEELKLLSSKASTPVTLLKAKTFLVAVLFDGATLSTATHMATKDWKAAGNELLDILESLNANPMVRLSEDENVKEAFDDESTGDEKGAGIAAAGRLLLGQSSVWEEKKKKKAEEEKKKEDAAAALGAPGVQYVHGTIYSFVQRMTQEYRKALQNIDPHTADYVSRLKDEGVVVELVSATQAYYGRLKKPEFEAKAALLHLELVYYMVPKESKESKDSKEKKREGKGEAKEVPASERKLLTPEAGLVYSLAGLIFKHGDPLARTQALLYQVYHLAVSDRFAEARDLLLMSHMQDNIAHVDIRTKILFNRTMAQIGLCAFRVGDSRQALFCLGDLYQSGRVKELLAQGVSSARFHERDEKQEKLERERQFPYHMHINLDMLEAVHLVSAMFVEVPNLLVHGTSNKRRVISKSFRRLLDHHHKQAFNGPPENTRDLVMAATKALQVGEWQKCLAHLLRLRMWDVMRGADAVKAQLKIKVQEEALKAYLITYSTQYMSISLTSLIDMFELPAIAIQKIASKMMVNEQLQGAWDEPSGCIIMHAVELSRLQKAALAYADKAALFVEQNERLMDPRSGYARDDRSGGGERSGGGDDEGRASGEAGERTGESAPRGERSGGGSRGGRGRGGRGGGGGGGGDRARRQWN